MFSILKHLLVKHKCVFVLVSVIYSFPTQIYLPHYYYYFYKFDSSTYCYKHGLFLSASLNSWILQCKTVMTSLFDLEPFGNFNKPGEGQQASG